MKCQLIAALRGKIQEAQNRMGANARVVAAVSAYWLVTPANGRPKHAGGGACATLVVSDVSSPTINEQSVLKCFDEGGYRLEIYCHVYFRKYQLISC
jgi:hypothetical protein